jgi:hypothetical protein
MKKTQRAVELALALVCVCALAHSTPLGPTPATPDRQSAPSATQQTASRDQSAASSLYLLVAQQPSSVSAATAPDTPKHAEDRWSHDWWLVYVTGLLAAITFALAVYTARLYAATVDLGREAKSSSRRQARETGQSLRIADKQALLAGRQAELAEKQHGLERLQFLVTNRPRLIVRRITLHADHGGGAADDVPVLVLVICNIGDTACKLLEASASVLIQPTDRIRGDLQYADPIHIGERLESGGIVTIPIPQPAAVAQSIALGQTRNVQRPRVFAHGYVRYHGDGSTDVDDPPRRITAFLRRYDFETERCHAVADPEYEYQD